MKDFDTLFNYAKDKNANDFEKTFNNIITNMASQYVEDRKKVVAQSLFAKKE